MAVLLDRGANIEATDPGGSTPLIQAAFHGHTDVVQLLLARNANVNAATKVGLTALMVAAHNGKADVVPLILDQGADPAAKNNFGQTAYEMASAEKLGNDLKARLKPTESELGRKRKADPSLDDNDSAKPQKPKTGPPPVSPVGIEEQPGSEGTEAAPAPAAIEQNASTPAGPEARVALALAIEESGTAPTATETELGKPLEPSEPSEPSEPELS